MRNAGGIRSANADMSNEKGGEKPPRRKLAAKGKGKTQEQIVAGFQELRQQQRAIASKISELNADLKEHEIVIETLKDMESDRKCFRMVGGVLVEHTVDGVREKDWL